MGRKFHYPKRKYRHGGKASLVGALLSALAGRRHHRPYGHDPYHHGYAPYPQRRSVKSSILSYLLKRLLKKIF